MGEPKSAWAVAEHRLRRMRRQGLRLAGWWARPDRWPAAERYSEPRHGPLEVSVMTERVPISRSDPWADPALEAGKRQNLALAAPAFDGLWISPERPLSFWRVLGPAVASRGYTWGVELRGGCIVPAIAGGLCLLSNGLFALAARAGWAVLERHGHSLEAIPPTPGVPMLDATVAFPDVDLVVAPRAGPVRLSVSVRDDALVLEAFAAVAPSERFEVTANEAVVARNGERFRESRLSRQLVGANGRAGDVELLASSQRRILAPSELGRNCLTCGEHECRDRPREAVLTGLRRVRAGQR